MPRSSTPKVWKKADRSKNFKKTVKEDEIHLEASTSQSLPTSNEDRKSASAKKLSNLEETYSKGLNTREFGNEIIDLNILNNIFKNNVCCKICHQEGLTLKVGKRFGLATEITFSCDVCDYNCNFFSSMLLGNDDISNSKNVNTKGSVFECNLRLVYGLRAIGSGQSAAQTFCGIMNLPCPPQKFMKYVNEIGPVVQNVTEESMKNAVEEAVECNENSRDLKTAFDGSWQKRGHTSRNGFVSMTSVDTGKVLDIEVLSKYCQCKDSNNHDSTCCANYSGSSGGMETAGVIAIYQRSSHKHNVRYLQYLGDGDSKAYKTVNEMEVYGSNIGITKLECIGHVQKRMGSRLRRFKASMKNQKLEDGKPLSGKNRLTDALIDKIQLYYGLAIRRNVDSVENMRKGVWAMYFHLCSQDNDPQHGLCPPGPDSWCGFRKSETIEGYNYTHKHSVPQAVMTAIKPIIKDLSSPQLLQKCTHGRTQNPNESLNNVVWSRIPKTVFVAYKTLVFGVYEAVGCFNDGNIVRCRVLEQIGMDVGVHTKAAMLRGDRERLRKAQMAVLEYEKLARQRKRQVKRRLEDTYQDADNPEYGPGLY